MCFGGCSQWTVIKGGSSEDFFLGYKMKSEIPTDHVTRSLCEFFLFFFLLSFRVAVANSLTRCFVTFSLGTIFQNEDDSINYFEWYTSKLQLFINLLCKFGSYVCVTAPMVPSLLYRFSMTRSQRHLLRELLTIRRSKQCVLW